jgi:hypothetical protein
MNVRCFRCFLYGSVLLASLLESIQPVRAQEAVDPSVVNYTGALFGYYRKEPTIPGLVLPAVKTFEARWQGIRKELLLGMGDNFGPEFGASLQLTGRDTRDPCYTKVEREPNSFDNRPPATLYKNDERVAPSAECDNVVKFLLDQRYRAIVPGREDFLYSADWLRQIAILLRKHSKGSDTPLHMLAANLRVTSDQPNNKECPLLLASGDSEAGVAPRCVDSLGEKVPEAQDWIDRLDLVRMTPHLRSQIVAEAKEHPEVRRQVLVNEVSQLKAMNPEPNAKPAKPGWQDLADTKGYRIVTKSENGAREINVCVADSRALDDLARLVSALGQQPASPASTDLHTFAQELLEKIRDLDDRPNAPGSVCTSKQPSQPATTSAGDGQNKKDFLLSDDGLQAGRHALLRVIATEEENVGFTFVKTSDGTTTLLMGVVGVETMNAVSPTNLCLDPPASVPPSPGPGASPAKKRSGSSASPCQSPRNKRMVATLDPRRTALVVLRAATLIAQDCNRQVARTILMAQMPHTEAQELAAHLVSNLKFRKEPNSIALVLSEAQAEHATPDGEHIAFAAGSLVPVLSPHPAFNRNFTDGNGGLVNPISVARFVADGISNETDMSRVDSDPYQTTALGQLETEIGWVKKTGPTDDDGAAFTEVLLREMQRGSGADAVMLERRDIYLSKLPETYAGYEVCGPGDDKEEEEQKNIPGTNQAPYGHRLSPADWKYCRIRTALDRVLWKGDYSERVMVTGKDLKSMLSTAQNQEVAQGGLGARDTVDQWLVTFGITTNDPQQLTRLEVQSNRFVLPSDAGCRGNQSSPTPETPYCVNGSSIQDDAAYWVATSDAIAQDGTLYKVMNAEPADYHRALADHFITYDLAAVAVNHPQDSQSFPPNAERIQQQRALLHIDYSKLVAGFNIRHPVGGNAAAAGFQGASDTRASQPTQQELDLESVNRTYGDLEGQFPFSLGVLSDAEYDRATLGNLTGKPVNASYAVNSLSVGGFLQKRIPFFTDAKTKGSSYWANRELPRSFVVLTPHQYQQQLNGSFLFIPFSSGPSEFTLHLPIVTGFVDKIGLRHENGGGKWWYPDRTSYLEAGMQLGVQNNILQSLTLFTQGQGSRSCSAAQNITISACFSQPGFTIDKTTTVIDPSTQKSSVSTETLHTSGFYWDLHIQKGLAKDKALAAYGINLSLDTKGDFFFERPSGKSLSTQTRYDIPVTYAVNFPIFRNLSLSPTFSQFLFENQVTFKAIVYNTFTISAKWYMARDSAVPKLRQLVFRGPATADQTKTAKMK